MAAHEFTGDHEDVKKRRISIRYQYYSAICSNLIMFAHGTSSGWGNTSYLPLMASDSPLPSGPLNINEASWVVSLLGLGAFTGNILIAMISHRFGRKKLLMFLALPQIISWLLVMFAHNVYYLYLSRLLAGLVAGFAFVLIPLFVSEIADDRMRGTLGSFMVLAFNAGTLFSFIVGAYCRYDLQTIIYLIVPIIFCVLFSVCPESPQYLTRKSRPESQKLAKSLKFYRGVPQEVEMARLSVEKSRPEIEKDQEESQPKLTLADFTNTTARKAILIGVAMSTLNILNGIYIMTNYTTAIFKQAGSTLTPDESAIVIAAIQLLANIIAAVLADSAGRKVLLIVSSTGTGLGLACMACYTMLGSDEAQWIPLVAFSSAVFMCSLGVFGLPFVVISEIMPEKIRDPAVSFCITLNSAYIAILNKLFPLGVLWIGLHGCIFMFAGCCFLSVVYIYFCMPETKDRSYRSIMHLLEK